MPCASKTTESSRVTAVDLDVDGGIKSLAIGIPEKSQEEQ
jgi:hypothetical protein